MEAILLLDRFTKTANKIKKMQIKLTSMMQVFL